MTPERKVGAVAAVALAVLVAGVFIVGKVNLGLSGYDLKVRYRFVSGLRENAAVRYAGGPIIGQVKRLEVDDEMVTAHLWIDGSVRIREDCEFWIYTAGLLGEQYVEVNASPGGEAPHLKDGAVIRGIDPVSFDATLIRLGKIVDALAPVFGKEEVADSIHSVVKDLGRAAKKISAVVDRHAGNVDSALGDLAKFSQSLNRMAKDLERISANLREISDPKDPQGVQGSIAKLNSAMDNLEKTTVTMRGVVKKLDEGKGLLGLLINDPELAADFKKVIKKLKDEPIKAKVRLF